MLLPYASDRPPKYPPVAVVALVLLNFLVFGLVALVYTVRGPAIPVLWYANLGLSPANFRPYQLLTYAFLHEDVFHLSGNMLLLWVFGASVEDAVRWKRFLLLYMCAAVVTGLLQVGITLALPGADRAMPIVGASGAVSAVVGVFGVRFYRSRIRFVGLPGRVPALVLLAAALFVEMGAALWQLASRTPFSGASVAHWAHVGGFLLGMVFAQASRMLNAGRQEYHAREARHEIEHGSPLAAVRRLEAVLRAQPDNVEALTDLARAWAEAGEEAEARGLYARAVSRCIAAGQPREAANLFQEMRRRYPSAQLPPPEMLAVAAAIEDTGDPRAAARAFRALIGSAPDAREAETARIRLAVLQLNRLNDAAGAERTLAEFLARCPESSWRSYAEDLLRAARARLR